MFESFSLFLLDFDLDFNFFERLSFTALRRFILLIKATIEEVSFQNSVVAFELFLRADDLLSEPLIKVKKVKKFEFADQFLLGFLSK